MIPIARLEDAGFHWRRKTFAYFLEGLLNLIKELKANGADGYRIEGTSYFFNSRTLEKLGFSMAEPSLWQRAKILVFSPELMLIYSFAQGRLSLPPVTRVKKAIAESTALIEHEDSIKQLYEKLNPRQEGEKANQSVQRTS